MDHNIKRTVLTYRARDRRAVLEVGLDGGHVFYFSRAARKTDDGVTLLGELRRELAAEPACCPSDEDLHVVVSTNHCSELSQSGVVSEKSLFAPRIALIRPVLSLLVRRLL